MYEMYKQPDERGSTLQVWIELGFHAIAVRSQVLKPLGIGLQVRLNRHVQNIDQERVSRGIEGGGLVAQGIGLGAEEVGDRLHVPFAHVINLVAAVSSNALTVEVR